MLFQFSLFLYSFVCLYSIFFWTVKTSKDKWNILLTLSVVTTLTFLCVMI